MLGNIQLHYNLMPTQYFSVQFNEYNRIHLTHLFNTQLRSAFLLFAIWPQCLRMYILVIVSSGEIGQMELQGQMFLLFRAFDTFLESSSTKFMMTQTLIRRVMRSCFCFVCVHWPGGMWEGKEAPELLSVTGKSKSKSNFVLLQQHCSTKMGQGFW